MPHLLQHSLVYHVHLFTWWPRPLATSVSTGSSSPTRAKPTACLAYIVPKSSALLYFWRNHWILQAEVTNTQRLTPVTINPPAKVLICESVTERVSGGFDSPKMTVLWFFVTPDAQIYWCLLRQISTNCHSNVCWTNDFLLQQMSTADNYSWYTRDRETNPKAFDHINSNKHNRYA